MHVCAQTFIICQHVKVALSYRRYTFMTPEVPLSGFIGQLHTQVEISKESGAHLAVTTSM